MSSTIVIVGSGGHAKSVANVAKSCGYKILAFVDDKNAGVNLLGIPIINSNDATEKYSDENFFIAIGNNAARKSVSKKYKSKLPHANFPSLIHKSSVIGFDCEIEEGTILMAFSHVGPESKIGKFCIINTSSSIDHDCTIKDFTSIAPGVITGGNVNIGFQSAIGIGAVIKHDIDIGDNVVVGANSFVNKNIGNSVVVFGTPSKEVRPRNPNENNL